MFGRKRKYEADAQEKPDFGTRFDNWTKTKKTYEKTTGAELEESIKTSVKKGKAGVDQSLGKRGLNIPRLLLIILGAVVIGIFAVLIFFNQRDVNTKLTERNDAKVVYERQINTLEKDAEEREEVKMEITDILDGSDAAYDLANKIANVETQLLYTSDRTDEMKNLLNSSFTEDTSNKLTKWVYIDFPEGSAWKVARTYTATPDGTVPTIWYLVDNKNNILAYRGGTYHIKQKQFSLDDSATLTFYGQKFEASEPGNE